MGMIFDILITENRILSIFGVISFFHQGPQFQNMTQVPQSKKITVSKFLNGGGAL
jgi:hypothetical protein